MVKLMKEALIHILSIQLLCSCHHGRVIWLWGCHILQILHYMHLQHNKHLWIHKRRFQHNLLIFLSLNNNMLARVPMCMFRGLDMHRLHLTRLYHPRWCRDNLLLVCHLLCLCNRHKTRIQDNLSKPCNRHLLDTIANTYCQPIFHDNNSCSFVFLLSLFLSGLLYFSSIDDGSWEDLGVFEMLKMLIIYQIVV